MSERTVFVDLETDRLDPTTANIIQIAAIAVDRDTLEAIEEFEVKVKFDESQADQDALERNSWDVLEWDLHAIRANIAMDKFTQFIKSHATWRRTSARGKTYTTCEIGGHNIAQYDAPIIQRWYKDADVWCPCATYASMVVDTMFWARSVEYALGERWGTGFSNKALCDRFGIMLEGEHDALNDIRATVELARHLRRMMVPQPATNG